MVRTLAWIFSLEFLFFEDTFNKIKRNEKDYNNNNKQQWDRCIPTAFDVTGEYDDKFQYKMAEEIQREKKRDTNNNNRSSDDNKMKMINFQENG